MVFQRFNLCPHLTALDNVMDASVGVSKRDKSAARDQATALLERVGLGDKAKHYPAELSVGQPR